MGPEVQPNKGATAAMAANSDFWKEPEVKQGWLLKRAGNWDFWHRYYAVVRGTSLAFYTVEDPLGELDEPQLVWHTDRRVDLLLCCAAALPAANTKGTEEAVAGFRLLGAHLAAGVIELRCDTTAERVGWVQCMQGICPEQQPEPEPEPETKPGKTPVSTRMGRPSESPLAQDRIERTSSSEAEERVPPHEFVRQEPVADVQTDPNATARAPAATIPSVDQMRHAIWRQLVPEEGGTMRFAEMARFVQLGSETAGNMNPGLTQEQWDEMCQECGLDGQIGMTEAAFQAVIFDEVDTTSREHTQFLRNLFEHVVPLAQRAELHVAASVDAPPTVWRTREQFPDVDTYGEYIKETLQVGMRVRANCRAEGTIEAGDTGVFVQTNGGEPPCQVRWDGHGDTYWVQWYHIDIIETAGVPAVPGPLVAQQPTVNAALIEQVSVISTCKNCRHCLMAVCLHWSVAKGSENLWVWMLRIGSWLALASSRPEPAQLLTVRAEI